MFRLKPCRGVSSLCLIAIILQSNFSVSTALAQELPTQDDVRTSLIALQSKVSSFRINLETDVVLGRAGGSEVWPTNYKAQYTTAGQGDSRLFFQSQVEGKNGADVIQIHKDNLSLVWNRSPVGAGNGMIRDVTAVPDDFELEIDRVIPQHNLLTSFLFNAKTTNFAITQKVEHAGQTAVQIEWESNGWKFVALLDPKYGYMPLSVERRYANDGKLYNVTEWSNYQPVGDTFVAKEVSVRSSVIAGQYKKTHAVTLPQSVNDGETLQRIERYRLDDIQLNKPLPESQFEMPWAAGTEIVDQIKGIKYYWKMGELEAQQAALNSFGSPLAEKRLDKLVEVADSQQAALAKETNQQGRSAAVLETSIHSKTLWVVIGAVLLIATVTTLGWFRRRQVRRGGVG